MGYLVKILGWCIVGLITGAGLTLINMLIYAVAGGIAALDGTTITPLNVSKVYIIGGVTGGLLVGLLNFLGRWTWGQAVLGIIGVTPMVLGASILYNGGVTDRSLTGMAVISTLGGTFLGIALGQEARRLFRRH